MEKPQTVGLSYNTKDQWEIPKSSLRLIREMGSKCVIPSTGGEAPDSWTVVQHQGPVGDPQEFSTTHTRDRPRTVRKGLRRAVEQHDPSGDQNSQAR